MVTVMSVTGLLSFRIQFLSKDNKGSSFSIFYSKILMNSWLIREECRVSQNVNLAQALNSVVNLLLQIRNTEQSYIWLSYSSKGRDCSMIRSSFWKRITVIWSRVARGSISSTTYFTCYFPGKVSVVLQNFAIRLLQFFSGG